MITPYAADAVFATLRLTLQTLHRKGVISDDDIRDIVAELELEARTVEIDEPGDLGLIVNTLRQTFGIQD